MLVTHLCSSRVRVILHLQVTTVGGSMACMLTRIARCCLLQVGRMWVLVAIVTSRSIAAVLLLRVQMAIVGMVDVASLASTIAVVLVLVLLEGLGGGAFLLSRSCDFVPTSWSLVRLLMLLVSAT